MSSVAPPRSTRFWWLHIAALWTICVAQPLLDLIARDPDFLVAHRVNRADVLVLPLVLVFMSPALLVAVTAAVGTANKTARALTVDTLVAIFGGLMAMQLGKRISPHGAVVIPVACAAGIVCALAYHHRAWARTFVSVLVPSVAIVPLVFWWQPNVSRLLSTEADRASAGARGTVEPRNIPVVVLVFDEVPLVSLLDAERLIDAALFPNIAELASDGVWFRNATTVSDYTRWALPAIVTGRHPRPDASPSARDYPESLFSLLGDTHQVHVVESVTDLCPDHVCGRADPPARPSVASLTRDLYILYQYTVLPADLTGHLPDVTAQWAHFQAATTQRAPRPTGSRRRRSRRVRPSPDERLQHINRLVASIQRHDSNRPGVYFLHSLLSHSPHWLLPSGQVDGTRSTANPLQLPAALPGRKRDPWPRDEWAIAQAEQRYLLQLGYVDVIIGRVLGELKTADMYDRSLVVLLSDHGAAFRPGLPRRDYTEDTAAEIMRVPLVVKLPRDSVAIRGTVRAGGLNVNDRNVETVDLVPTIADVLGIPVPWNTDGTSLVDPSGTEPATKTMFYDMARRRRDYDRNGPDMGPALRRHLATYGERDNPYRVPRLPLSAELVGRNVASLPIVDGGCAAAVDYLSDFSKMDLEADVVPFEFAGRLESRPPGGSGVLAIGVNGTIRAITRPWLAAPREWLSTPPLDAWRDGANQAEVFSVESSARGTVLRRCAIREGRSH